MKNRISIGILMGNSKVLKILYIIICNFKASGQLDNNFNLFNHICDVLKRPTKIVDK